MENEMNSVEDVLSIINRLTTVLKEIGLTDDKIVEVIRRVTEK